MPGSGRLWLSAAAACALAACEPPTDPLPAAERRLLVQAVLDAGSIDQYAKIQWIQSGFGRRLTDISGASVLIEAPDGQVFSGVEVAPGSELQEYRISGLGIGGVAVIPGGTYTLRVRVPTGEEVTGTTTVPVAAEDAIDISVVTELNRSRDTVHLEWPRIVGAKRYQVTVESRVAQSEVTFSYVYSLFTDTTVTLAGTARTLENDPVFLPGSVARVHVAAVDANYYEYYHPNFDPFAGAPPTRLTGAVGVFGSVVPMALRIYQTVR